MQSARLSWRELSVLVALCGACGESSDSADAGTSKDAGPTHHCPVYDAPKLDATGSFENEAFTVACRFEAEGESALFTSGARQGTITCNQSSLDGLKVFVDIRSEPAEQTYENGTVVNVRVSRGTTLLTADAINKTAFSVEVDCWNPDTLQFGGAFAGTWVDDGTSENPFAPEATTAFGDIQGSWMVRFNDL